MRQNERGVTLIEVLVALAIFAIIASLVYGAFDGIVSTRNRMTHAGDRYHQGRNAIDRIARELQSAYLSLHAPVDETLNVRSTAFIGTDSRPTDRVDFNSFSHRRLVRDSHESDEAEISYFGSRDPNRSGKLDLVRRESVILDLEPTRGGVVQVVAEDIESFDIRYFDPVAQVWSDTWDSSQESAQLARLPLEVLITLVLRANADDDSKLLTFQTKVMLPIQAPLNFAIATRKR